MALIDFQFEPVPKAEYSEEEVNHELVSSVKAFHLCAGIAKEFYECRKTPSGKVALPELCVEKGFRLFTCYNYVKQVPKGCENQYVEVKKCLDKGTGDCSGLMNKYVECYPNDLPNF